jgi:hypothetical protein
MTAFYFATAPRCVLLTAFGDRMDIRTNAAGTSRVELSGSGCVFNATQLYVDSTNVVKLTLSAADSSNGSPS